MLDYLTGTFDSILQFVGNQHMLYYIESFNSFRQLQDSGVTFEILLFTMESIISVFFGVCFPHTVEYIEEDGIERFYMPVYEPSKA
ncbi:hypothetical protein A0J61_11561 [Choanephora cucurbitarum]|uniref:Uncharacterized protein n=1 Tax=Choanephora cucurbitarum TaxID=101091 RepID=A0A1C7MU67_9FUNG|nr:hypothetical protein A0J61_11561 [Choanephora cucurbitarum]